METLSHKPAKRVGPSVIVGRHPGLEEAVCGRGGCRRFGLLKNLIDYVTTDLKKTF